MEFGRETEKRRPFVKNRPEIFGRQIIMDHEDSVLGEEENLLLHAAELTLEEGKLLCESYGGAAYPANIDRESNGIVSVLGDIPESAGYYAYELKERGSYEEYLRRFPHLKTLQRLVSSDAHYLWDISEAENSIDILDEPYSGDLVRHKLIEIIRGGGE